MYTLGAVSNVRIINCISAIATGYLYDSKDNELEVRLEIDYSKSASDSDNCPSSDWWAEVTKVSVGHNQEISLDLISIDEQLLIDAVSGELEEEEMY